MSISGIVMACRREHARSLGEQVNALPWAQVHHTDQNGRMVVTVEAPDVDGSVERLQELKQLPHVLMAEMAGFFEEQA